MDTQQPGEPTSAVKTTPPAERNDRPYQLLTYIQELARTTGMSYQWAAWAIVYEDQMKAAWSELGAIPPWPQA